MNKPKIYGQAEAIRMETDRLQAEKEIRFLELDSEMCRTRALSDIAAALQHIAKYGLIHYHVPFSSVEDAKHAFALGRSVQLQNYLDPLIMCNPEQLPGPVDKKPESDPF